MLSLRRLFCSKCSTHRVANRGLADNSSLKHGEPAILRVCDRCAFSTAHPEHLGCEHPFGCTRCSAPRDTTQFMVYLKLFLRMLVCCSFCNPFYWRRRSGLSQLPSRAGSFEFDGKATFQPPLPIPHAAP